MPKEWVVDTCVLQKANAPITSEPRERSLFAKRIRLLLAIRNRDVVILYSRRLLQEYSEHIMSPRNDFIRAFFAILSDPDGAVLNWPRFTNADRERARKCRYPREDGHVLRTAIRPNVSTIITEAHAMLLADECIHREFRVHIKGVEHGNRVPDILA